MVMCSGCAEDNPDRARFCLGCGSSLAEQRPPREVRKTVSVLFCDLVDSTQLAERLDPEALRSVLDRYFAVLRQQIEAHGGIVEKYIGDAVMAVFGIPVLHEDDALRAVHAAATIPLAVDELNGQLEPRCGVRLQVRIGVSTGEVVAGIASSGGQRLATGDAVNLAARLQGLAEPGGVVLAATTHRLVRDAVRAEPLEPVAVKGKADLVRTWRLLALEAGTARPMHVDTPLVGRGAELRGLQLAFADAVETCRPRRLVLLGAAGVGKSRLLAELLTSLPAAATVLRGRCLSYGQGITFWPVREMLASAAGWTEDDTAEQALAKLADLLPGRPDAEELADRVGQLIGLGEATASLQECFRAVTAVLSELAAWAPVVVVADDLHWAEPTLLDLLDHLAAHVQAPVLLLGAARPELLETHPGWADGDHIGLQPLVADDSARLLAGLLASGDPPPAVVEHVLATAEGNPLFVEQLVAMLLEDGILARTADGGWALIRGLRRGELPVSITSLVAARLERLAPAEQRELQAAAVVGRVFWRGAVAELAREAVGGDAGAHLDSLVGRSLILPEPPGLLDDDAYKFTHVLVRDAAYAAMPKTERATAHQRFATWLEHAVGDRAGEYDEILGYHLEQAVQLRAEVAAVARDDAALALRAGRQLTSAAQRAVNRGDVGTAVPLLRRAERLSTDDPAAHVDVLLELSRLLVHSGELVDASESLASVLEESARLGDRRRQTRALLLKAEFSSFADPTWSPEGALPPLLEAVAVFEQTGDEAGSAETWFSIGRLQLDAGRARQAEVALDRAIEHARRSVRPSTAALPQIYLLIALLAGPLPLAEVAVRLEGIAADAGGNLDVDGQVLAMSAQLEAMQRRFDRAWALIAAARRVFEDLGLVLGPAACAMTEYEIAVRQGRPVAAESSLRLGERLCDETGNQSVRSTLLAMLADVHVRDGRLEQARSEVELAERTTQEDDVLSEVLWRSVAARLASLDGHQETALDRAREAVDIASRTDWLCLHGDALLALGDVHERAGREAEAQEATQAALALYDRKGDLASADRARGMLRPACPGPR